MPKTRLDKDIKKDAFIEAYRKSFGNISISCKEIGISRQKYYDWLNEEDQVFKNRLEAIEPDEIFIDFAENALITRISKGDTIATIFALKTRGKKRGYVEKQEVDHTSLGQQIFLGLPPSQFLKTPDGTESIVRPETETA